MTLPKSSSKDSQGTQNMKALPIRFPALIFVCLFSGRDRFHIAINQMDIFPQIMSKPWKWIHDVYTNYRFIIMNSKDVYKNAPDFINIFRYKDRFRPHRQMKQSKGMKTLPTKEEIVLHIE